MKNLLSGKKVSLVACGLLLSSSMVFAADSIDSAFKEGKVSGSLAVYGEKHDAKDEVKDSGFGNGQIVLDYETGEFKGFSAKGEFKGNLSLGEIEKGDRTAPGVFQNNALMTEAYLKYANSNFFAKAGRQAIDLEWLSHYHEAVVAGITAIPDTTVVVGFTKRKSKSVIDQSDDFHNINGNKGAYVMDIKYTGLKVVEFNPYYYSAPDVADWYGLKATFKGDELGAVAHYAASNEDSEKQGELSNGSIGNVELNTSIKDFTAAIGYIKTDKKVGAGSMSVAGDNINPLDSGNHIYSVDSKTPYAKLGYTLAGVKLGAIYGEMTYETEKYKEKELNLVAEHSFTNSLSAKLLYGIINADSNDTSAYDDNYITAKVEYKF